MTIQQLTDAWKDEPQAHLDLFNAMTEETNADPLLKAHRDWVEEKIFGFGERAFHALWKSVVEEMPSDFTFMEIGCFRFQVVSLIKLLANRTGRSVTRYGVTPLDNTGGHWESDYAQDAITIHDAFDLDNDYIVFKGLSTDAAIIKQAKDTLLDILYVDGGHDYAVAYSDITNYSPMIKTGGYLVVDDAANRFKIPHGMFPGIATVTDAVAQLLPPFTPNDNFQFLFSVGHNLVWRKTK